MNTLDYPPGAVVVQTPEQADPSAIRVTLFHGDKLGGLEDMVCGWLIGPPPPGQSQATYFPSMPNVAADEVLRLAASLAQATGARVYVIEPDHLCSKSNKLDRAA